MEYPISHIPLEKAFDDEIESMDATKMGENEAAQRASEKRAQEIGRERKEIIKEIIEKRAGKVGRWQGNITNEAQDVEQPDEKIDELETLPLCTKLPRMLITGKSSMP